MSNNYEYYDITYPFIDNTMKSAKGGIQNIQLYVYKYPDGIKGTPIGLFLTSITTGTTVVLTFEVRFTDGVEPITVNVTKGAQIFTGSTSWCTLTVKAVHKLFKTDATFTANNMVEPCCCIWAIKMDSIFTAKDENGNPVLIDPKLIGKNWSVTYGNGTIEINGLYPADAEVDDVDRGIVSINGLTAETISIKTSSSLSLTTGRSTITIGAPQNE